MALLRLLPLFALLSAAVLKADEAESFRSELFFAPAPIHVRYEFNSDKEDEIRSRKSVTGIWERTGKVSIAPEFHGKLRHIGGGALYDMRGIMREWGLALPEGSFAMVAPEAQLLFLRSTPADLKLADACLETSVRLPRAISFDVQITAKSAAHGEQKLFSGKAIGTQLGQTTQLTSTGGSGDSAHKIELALEPVNEPSGTNVQVGLEGTISYNSSQSRVTTTIAAEFGKEVETELSLDQHTDVTLKFTFRQKVLGLPAPLESEEAKKQAIADIEADLLKASGASR